LNRTASFYGPDGEPTRIRKAAHDPSLPLKRARNRLVDFPRIIQVHHVDMALRGPNNHEVFIHVLLRVQRVDALAAVQRRHRVRRLQVPELDGLVPGSGREVVDAVCVEPSHAFDGFAVGFGFLGRDFAAVGRGAQVGDVDVTRRVAACYARAVLVASLVARFCGCDLTCYVQLTRRRRARGPCI
jgi:hypothetical protein